MDACAVAFREPSREMCEIAPSSEFDNSRAVITSRLGFKYTSCLIDDIIFLMFLKLIRGRLLASLY